MIPKPWSFSSLDSFDTCPRKYAETSVYKTVAEDESVAMEYGSQVHKAFEDRIRDGLPLRPDLRAHETYMQKLELIGQKRTVEKKVGLTRQLEPCDFWAPNVWCRIILDFEAVAKFEKQDRTIGIRATLVDYKTGNPKRAKPKQLALGALYEIAKGADIVDSRFYWTANRDESHRVVNGREDQAKLLTQFVPSLKAYGAAFNTETFPPKPGGLCKGWCPVQDCEFWRPKDSK